MGVMKRLYELRLFGARPPEGPHASTPADARREHKARRNAAARRRRNYDKALTLFGEDRPC